MTGVVTAAMGAVIERTRSAMDEVEERRRASDRSLVAAKERPRQC
jgi:hypothetical protein